jgi:hypothetical protein
MMDDKTSIMTWILKTFLRREDYLPSLRGVDKIHYRRYAERCPRCKAVLSPTKKRAFQKGMKTMSWSCNSPPSPCSGPRCVKDGALFWGYLRGRSKEPRYRLFLFHKTRDHEMDKFYENVLQDAIDDRYRVDMWKYRNRKSGYC